VEKNAPPCNIFFPAQKLAGKQKRGAYIEL
jgi:hypothetical protein